MIITFAVALGDVEIFAFFAGWLFSSLKNLQVKFMARCPPKFSINFYNMLLKTRAI